MHAQQITGHDWKIYLSPHRIESKTAIWEPRRERTLTDKKKEPRITISKSTTGSRENLRDGRSTLFRCATIRLLQMKYTSENQSA